MTGMTDSPDLAPLYDRDFQVWTVEQAALLRREAERRLNTDLDLLHLAEEIEALGKRDRRALESHLARIVEHLLKLRFSPAADPRDGWIDTVDRHRSKVARILRDSPSLERELPDLLPTPRRRASASPRGASPATGSTSRRSVLPPCRSPKSWAGTSRLAASRTEQGLPMHAYANPLRFQRIADAVFPWVAWGALLLSPVALYLALAVAPADYQQGEAYRIIFVHVPAAWMALFSYLVVAAAAPSGWSGATRWPRWRRAPPRRSAPPSPPWRCSPAASGASRCGALGGSGTRASPQS
jgi:hypothetical protein